MLISAAGRIARAYSVETPGVHNSEWTIENIAAQHEAIRHTDTPLEFSVLPTGHMDHLRYSFAIAKQAQSSNDDSASARHKID